MVNSVSGLGIGYANNARAMDTIPREQLYNPGLYALQDLLQIPPEKEKGGFISFLTKSVIAAGVVGGALVVAKKSINPDLLKELAPDAKFMDKTKHYVAKSGDWVEKTSVAAYNKVKGFFTKKAENVAEAESKMGTATSKAGVEGNQVAEEVAATP